jgi:hypothetical protein
VSRLVSTLAFEFVFHTSKRRDESRRGTQELSLRRCRIEQGMTFGFTARYSAREPDRS